MLQVCFVHMDGLGLGVVVGSIVLASPPYDNEQFLRFPALEPAHSFVIYLGSLRGHGLVDQTLCSGVICDYTGG